MAPVFVGRSAGWRVMVAAEEEEEEEEEEEVPRCCRV